MTTLPAVLAGLTLLVAGGGTSVTIPAQGAEGDPPPQAAPAPAADTAGDLRVFLMTMGQGPAIWEHFGHNALVIQDEAAGTSTAWHWGLFDFNQVDFIPRFLRGEQMYWMDGFDAGGLARAYQRANRDVTVQELDLTREQARELQEFVRWNARPENRFYRYDYFIDNCSTRLRDALDRVLDGALSEQFADRPSGFGYRHETERLTRRAVLDYLGITLMLGPRGDVERTLWEQMFTPLNLQPYLRSATVPNADGSRRPLVISEQVAVRGTRPLPAEAPPRWVPWFLLLGAGLGALFAGLGHLAARGGRLAAVPLAVAGGLWSLLAGVTGVLLVLVHWTNHIWMYWNENVLQLNPLSLAVALALPIALLADGGLRRTRALAVGVAGIAVVGFVLQALPFVNQENGVVLGLALPAHLGLAWAVLRVARSREREAEVPAGTGDRRSRQRKARKR